MFRLYRKIQKGEFFVVFGDCAQGGSDSNCVQFMSKTNSDIPLKLKMRGVAASMTPYLHQALEWIFDQTGVKPVVALERNNGGASEMHNLMMMNRLGKYRIYLMKTSGTKDGEEEEDKLGWDTNTHTRPKMLGDWKVAYDGMYIVMYDSETVDEHATFIINKKNKPEADVNKHDDEVISCAGAYQLYQTEIAASVNSYKRKHRKPGNFHV